MVDVVHAHPNVTALEDGDGTIAIAALAVLEVSLRRSAPRECKIDSWPHL